jgi:hypothetical protein
MVKKTNKRSIKNKRLTKRKRGGLFGISTTADRGQDGKLYKHTYNLKYDNGKISVLQNLVKLGNFYGSTEIKPFAKIGELDVGSVFYAKVDRSATARFLGKNKNVKGDEYEDQDREKNTWLSRAYRNSGLKSVAKGLQYGVSLGNMGAVGRWPETGLYIVTEINAKGWFSCARLEYITDRNKENIININEQIKAIVKPQTIGPIASVADDQLTAINNIASSFNSSTECSYSNSDRCLIGLNKNKIQIIYSNENFLNNMGFIKPKQPQPQPQQPDDYKLLLNDNYVNDNDVLHIFSQLPFKKQILTAALSLKLSKGRINAEDYIKELNVINDITE